MSQNPWSSPQKEPSRGKPLRLPPPVNVRHLDYRQPHVTGPRRKGARWWQFVLGLLGTNLTVVAATLALFDGGHGPSFGAAGGIASFYVAICLLLEFGTGWKGFLPGALCGLLMAPVSFFFTCASQLRF